MSYSSRTFVWRLAETSTCNSLWSYLTSTTSAALQLPVESKETYLQLLLIFKRCINIFEWNFTQLLNNKYTLYHHRLLKYVWKWLIYTYLIRKPPFCSLMWNVHKNIVAKWSQPNSNVGGSDVPIEQSYSYAKQIYLNVEKTLRPKEFW